MLHYSPAKRTSAVVARLARLAGDPRPDSHLLYYALSHPQSRDAKAALTQYSTLAIFTRLPDLRNRTGSA
jgi:hypothetical protein